MQDNIYAGYGKIATGDFYIPRKKLENELCSRILSYENFGSVSVVGMHRMGKSSLVYNAITQKAEDYYKKNIVIVSCSMDNYSNPEDFFRGIVEKVHETLEDHDDIDIRIESRYKKIENKISDSDLVINIQSFFKALLKLGKRVICVIDEFDYSRKLFADFKQGFSILRELAYQPEVNVTFIFVSRRMISELESQADISTLSNILGSPIYVRGYDENELEEYYKRSEAHGLLVLDDDKERIADMTGAQPYWLDILMYHYLESTDEDKSFEKIYDEYSGVFYREYEQLLKFLDEQNLLGKLYQIVIGPARDYTRSDVKKLLDYGIIRFKDEKAVLLSSGLNDYMRMKERTFDFYPLWNKTEHRLRKLLKLKLKERYGDDWDYKMRQSRYSGTLVGYLNQAISLQNKASNQRDLYVQNVPFTIIDGLTTSGIFCFYSEKYDWFQTALDMDINQFNKISQHISAARNPYQHNVDELINPTFKDLTKSYCELLNEKLDNYSKNFGISI